MNILFDFLIITFSAPMPFIIGMHTSTMKVYVNTLLYKIQPKYSHKLNQTKLSMYILNNHKIIIIFH